MCLLPYQVLTVVSEEEVIYNEEFGMPNRKMRVFTFMVTGDYKNFVNWSKKEVIMSKQTLTQ